MSAGDGKKQAIGAAFHVHLCPRSCRVATVCHPKSSSSPRSCQTCQRTVRLTTSDNLFLCCFTEWRILLGKTRVIMMIRVHQSSPVQIVFCSSSSVAWRAILYRVFWTYFSFSCFKMSSLVSKYFLEKLEKLKDSLYNLTDRLSDYFEQFRPPKDPISFFVNLDLKKLDPCKSAFFFKHPLRFFFQLSRRLSKKIKTFVISVQ